MNKRTVLLYGQSLLLSGVAASLEQCSSLKVAQAATWGEVSRLLERRVPDVFVFDRADSDDSHILPLLLRVPHLLMIALDVECDQGVLLSGERVQSFTMSRIMEIVKARAEPRKGMDEEDTYGGEYRNADG